MAITRTPMVDDDGTGTTGTIINNAWKQELYGQIDGAIGSAIAPLGQWGDVPFSAAAFWSDSPGMTWTVTAGNVLANRYMLIGKTLFWNLWIDGSTLGGTMGTQIRVTLPLGTMSRGYAAGPFVVALGAGGALQVFPWMTANDAAIRVAFLAVPGATSAFSLRANMIWEIQ